MEFKTHEQYRIPAVLNNRVKITYPLPLNYTLKRVNPLCPCITYKRVKDTIVFTIKPKTYSTKIVVLTYDDEIQQFIEFNIRPVDEIK